MSGDRESSTEIASDTQISDGAWEQRSAEPHAVPMALIDDSAERSAAVDLHAPGNRSSAPIPIPVATRHPPSPLAVPLGSGSFTPAFAASLSAFSSSPRSTNKAHDFSSDIPAPASPARSDQPLQQKPAVLQKQATNLSTLTATSAPAPETSDGLLAICMMVPVLKLLVSWPWPLLVIPPESSVRMWARTISTHPRFDHFITATIIANSIALGFSNPLDDPDDTKQRILTQLDYLFTAIFCLEFVLKAVDKGFLLLPGAYLLDTWNQLDFLVVVTSFISLAGTSGNFSFFRAFRILRPMKTLSRLSSMKVLLNSLANSTALLFNALMLCGFLFVFFGILGVQLFNGSLRNRCVNETTGEVTDVLCTRGQGYGARDVCGEGETCEEDVGPNPNFGFTSFDNIGWAFLVIFQCLTLEGWSDIMYLVQTSTTQLSSLYFVLLVFLVAFYMVNIALAVITSQYSEQAEALREESLNQLAKVPVKTSSDPQPLSEQNESDDESMSDSERKANLPFSEHKVVRVFQLIERHKWFDRVMTGCIAFNGVLLGMTYHNMPESYANTLDTLNDILVVLFALEMVVKIVSLSPKGYFTKPMNVFDSSLVILGLLELGVLTSNNSSAIRAFRLLRIFRLARKWKSLTTLVDTIIMSGESIIGLLVLLLLFMFVFTLLGMQMFAGNFNFPEGRPRAHFDDFYSAFLSVFQVLVIDNWTNIAFDAMRSTSHASILFFIAIIVIGDYVIFNLFIAILLDRFSYETSTKWETLSTQRQLERKRYLLAQDEKAAFMKSLQDACEDPGFKRRPTIFEQTPTPTDAELGQRGSFRGSHFFFTPSQDASEVDLSQATGKTMRLEETGLLYSFSSTMCAHPALSAIQDFHESHIDETFYCIPVNHPLRRYCIKLIFHPYFEYVSLGFVLWSCVNLAMDKPTLDPNSALAQYIEICDIVILFIFVIEMCAKVIALGFLFPRFSYMRSKWNLLDFLVVLFGLISLPLDSGSKSLKTIRLLRALRPLRLIRRLEDMKISVMSLVRSIPSMLNAMLLSLVFWFVFAVLGVQFFAGQFYSCNDDGVSDRSECVGTYFVDGVETPREWLNANPNFDSIISAFVSLFEIATMEGWTDVMYRAVDSAGVDKQPIKNNRIYMTVYFLVFIIVGAFFVVNLFVGIVIDNYARVKADLSGVGLMNKRQLEWIQTQRRIIKARPIPKIVEPTVKWRKLAFQLIMTWQFELFIGLMIFINIGMKLFDHHNQSEEYTDKTDKVDIFFTVLFLVEALIRISALSLKGYLSDRWNMLDAVIVLFSFIGLFLNFSSGVIIARIFRVTRLLRLVRRARGLKVLLATLVKALPSLYNTASLMFLCYFLYAVVGMSLFGDVKFGDALNENANFRDFGISVLTLFR
eukprot:TRINITY_DN1844_c0_g1_i3.p1 TRINITY_DN1844_c0_g1~~TRINITY_DN1844_c0_g1_i3.p1  ORF type:complete len:1384 (+),score=276.21 TRINITY_DN1844_c0_g1_i3:89-4240(+)